MLTPGNVNDATAFGQFLDGIRTPRLGTGRPRTTPDRVLGDKAYSSRAIRHLLRRRGIAATIPERRDQAITAYSSTFGICGMTRTFHQEHPDAALASNPVLSKLGFCFKSCGP